MKVLGTHLPSFAWGVRDRFLREGCGETTITAAIHVLEQREKVDPTYVMRLAWDIFYNLELDDFDTSEGGEISDESPYTIIRDMVYTATRQILWDEGSDSDDFEATPLKKEDLRRRQIPQT